MRGPVLSRDQQIHELPLTAEGASCFPETRNISAGEDFTAEALRSKALDGGLGLDRCQIQPRNVVLKRLSWYETVCRRA